MIHHAPIDRLEPELKRLERSGEMVVEYYKDPDRNQWVIRTAPKIEEREIGADRA